MLFHSLRASKQSRSLSTLVGTTTHFAGLGFLAMLLWGFPSTALGQAVTTYAIPTPASEPKGITKGPDGALWFTEFYG